MAKDSLVEVVTLKGRRVSFTVDEIAIVAEPDDLNAPNSFVLRNGMLVPLAGESYESALQRVMEARESTSAVHVPSPVKHLDDEGHRILPDGSLDRSMRSAIMN